VRAALLLAFAAAPALAQPRAEVQVALCEPFDALAVKLALTPREAPYETWQFDDASLALLERGVRVRLRMRERAAELTVKIAVADCDRVHAKKREGKCEYDVYAGKPQAALSLTRTLDASAARDLVAGRGALAQVLSDAQSTALRDIARMWPLPPRLRALGPIANTVYVDRRRNDVDVNTLPDGRRYVEISRKAPLADADGVQRDLAAQLAAAGVAVCADQRSEAATKLRRLANP
jgi:hypothetical protein